MVRGKKASRLKRSVARTRKTQYVNICLPESVAGLGMTAAAEEDEWDSNAQDQVVQTLPTGCQQRWGSLQRQNFFLQRREVILIELCIKYAASNNTKTTLITKFLFTLLGLSQRRSRYNSRILSQGRVFKYSWLFALNRDFPLPNLFYCLHSL